MRLKVITAVMLQWHHPLPLLSAVWCVLKEFNCVIATHLQNSHFCFEPSSVLWFYVSLFILLIETPCKKVSHPLTAFTSHTNPSRELRLSCDFLTLTVVSLFPMQQHSCQSSQSGPLRQFSYNIPVVSLARMLLWEPLPCRCTTPRAEANRSLEGLELSY